MMEQLFPSATEAACITCPTLNRRPRPAMVFFATRTSGILAYCDDCVLVISLKGLRFVVLSPTPLGTRPVAA